MSQQIILYKNLYNYIPSIKIPDEICHIRKNNLVLINESVKTGFYKKVFKVVNYKRECISNTKYKYIGRYTPSEFEVVDVIFDCDQKDELIAGEYGANKWTYGINTSCVAELVMKYVSFINNDNKKYKHKVIRYLAMCLDKKNFEKNALLEGRWNSNFDNGFPPMHWLNSYEICFQRLHSHTPIRYAQCWVFAECLTSFCRFLGIKARSVYVSNSQIDISLNRGIDIFGNTFFDKSSSENNMFLYFMKDNYIENTNEINNTKLNSLMQYEFTHKGELNSLEKYIKKGDSFWNFHVWTEIFIERPDLYYPYNKASWNFIDPSPNTNITNSLNLQFYGPVPVESVKEGDFIHSFDYEYLYSSINAYRRLWKKVFINNKTLIYVHKIEYSPQTKASVYNLNKETDITHKYRHPDINKSYKAYHKHYPIVFKRNSNNEIKVIHKNKYAESNFMFQIVFLNNSKVVAYYMNTYTKLTDLIWPEKITLINENKKEWNIINTIVIDKNHNKHWIQML